MKDLLAGFLGISSGITFLLLGLGMPVLIAKGYPGPFFFPMISSIVLMTSGMLLMLKYLTRRHRIRKMEENSLLENRELPTLKSFVASIGGFIGGKGYLSVTIFLTSLAAYISSINYIGFLLSSFIFMYIVMTIYGVRMIDAVIYSTITIIFIYMLFIVMFKIVIPEPILGSILPR
ncbi:MAG: tripartite tricarboxylate transporter TctB family protein [Desulfurococcales archaeon]|nr:tripartite tricarboxylate transporter TctB family protein [Desulfurococcales archaeon]